MHHGLASQDLPVGVINANREPHRLALHKEATIMKITNMLLIVAAAGTLVACEKSAPDTATPDVAAPEAPETPSADDVTDDATDEAAEEESADEESAEEADAEAPTAEE